MTEGAESFMANWNMRHFKEYVKEVDKGHHDDLCEQRERSSLCHCSKRRRERDGKTDLPTIWFPAPVCNGCGHDVEFDGDGFSCNTCKVSWDRHASEGDKADFFTDDYGDPSQFGGEQFGERLIVLASK